MLLLPPWSHITSSQLPGMEKLASREFVHTIKGMRGGGREVRPQGEWQQSMFTSTVPRRAVAGILTTQCDTKKNHICKSFYCLIFGWIAGTGLINADVRDWLSEWVTEWAMKLHDWSSVTSSLALARCRHMSLLPVSVISNYIPSSIS